jgi:hypothetical protein
MFETHDLILSPFIPLFVPVDDVGGDQHQQSNAESLRGTNIHKGKQFN